MVVSDNSPDNCKSLRIITGAIIKNLEILRFVPDHLKTIKMRKEIAIRNKLKVLSDCCKNKKTCNKAVDNYAHALKFVPDCHKTKKI